MKTNYHSHTIFCDGKNTPEEMVLSAVEKKFDIFGFSGHAMFPFGSDWHIQPKEMAAYAKEIRRLQKKYESKIKILLGFEADFIEGICQPNFDDYKEFSPDFLIGSAHYIVNQKGQFTVDDSYEATMAGIQKCFNGNVKEAVQEYFYNERKMLEKGNFTFVGHPDLFRKQNYGHPIFNENDSWYKKEVKATAKAIAKSGICVEVNTGGLSRGKTDFPYPSPYFLNLLCEYKVPVTINSDTHSCETLDFWFDEAVEYIKKAGYTELAHYAGGNYFFEKI